LAVTSVHARAGSGFETRVDLVDLRDQVVDAFRRVLAALIHLEKLVVERADAAFALLELAAQVAVLVSERSISLDQGAHRALEAIELVTVDVGSGNGETPRPTRSYRAGTKGVKRRVDSKRAFWRAQT
jgi:hypothetical protein